MTREARVDNEADPEDEATCPPEGSGLDQDVDPGDDDDEAVTAAHPPLPPEAVSGPPV